MRERPQKFCSMSTIEEEIEKIFEILFCAKNFLCRGRKEFWQTCRKNFARKPKMLAQCSKKVWKTNFFFDRKIFILKSSYGFYGHIEVSSDRSAGKTLNKGETFFSQCPETIRNKKFPIFFSEWSSGHV